jgi:hypothetical protein
MRKKLVQFAFLAGLVLSRRQLQSQEVVDRIVATVNGHAILLSDCEEDLRYQALLAGRAVETLAWLEERQSALERLMNQELLRQEIANVDAQQATPEEVAQRVQQIRQQHFGAEGGQNWQQVLQRYGLSEAELQDRIRLQIELTRLMEMRLRPNVQVDSESIGAYYREKFVPEVRKKGAQEPPLAQVSAQIREILTQQKLDELLTAWLQSLRQQSQIRVINRTLPSRTAGME